MTSVSHFCDLVLSIVFKKRRNINITCYVFCCLYLSLYLLDILNVLFLSHLCALYAVDFAPFICLHSFSNWSSGC